MFSGKKKAITFSYDDGVTQDIRLVELLNKYGMRATFNINSGLLGLDGQLVREGVGVLHNKIKPEDVRHIYEGHEIAAHTLTHPQLSNVTDRDEVIRQVEQDRIALSEICGYEVVGFAYPGGGKNYNGFISEIIRNDTGVKYARTTDCNADFGVHRENLFEFKPTAFHLSDGIFELGEKFLSLPSDTDALFYIWGHSYEFDIHDDWARFEEFLQMISGREDVFYGTNKEVLL